MSAAVIMLALFAAILHATWNAVLRISADRLWTITVMSFAMTIVAIPLAFMLPLPPASAWLYLILSSCLQVGYSIFLVAAYRYGELGQVYPIVRGSVPLLVTLSGFVLAGQHLTTVPIIGIVLVALGIMSLALGKGRAKTTSILFALATGLLIAAYTTVDAGGVVSLIAYGAVIAAFALGPVGPITALRETSVIFAALIGGFFLGETLTLRRIGACAIVALGAICLGFD